MSEEKKDPEPPAWEFKKEFAINARMREIALATKAVAETEVSLLRRKLERLTYGS